MLRRISSQLLAVGIFCAFCLPFSAAAQAGSAPRVATEEGPDEAELAKDSTTEINVKNADIAAIVRIFSKRTKRNYILDENVKGKVSIYLPGKVTEGEALKILDSTLAMKGFTSVPVSENLWKIVPLKDAKQSTIPTRLDEPAGPVSAAVVTRLLSLKYTNADDIKQLIGPLISAEGLVNAYTGTNSLMIIDSEDNIQRISSIVAALDVASTDRDMTIIPIVNAEAADIADKLNEILGNPSAKQASSGSESSFDLLRERIRESAFQAAAANRAQTGTGAPSLGGASSAGGKTISARSREPKIIADDRTNSIIVVADDEMTARIKALVSQLDSKVDLSGSRFYVYRCQHASAAELADVLAGIVGGSTGSTSSGSSRSSFGGGFNEDSDASIMGGSSSRNSSSRRSQTRNQRSQSRLAGQSRSPGSSRQSGSSNRSPATANLGENTSITADPATNSLIIMASKQDYLKILELLQKLDVKRRQVLVEAMLLEVGVTDSESAGTDWLTSTGGADGGILAGNNAGDIVGVLKDPEKLSGFSVAAASAGSLKLPGFTIPTQSVLLQAAQSNSNVNVLSAPTILATDNEQAEIVVGQNVPFVASQATNDTNLNNTFNQIDRQDVGITLRITPQISSEDSVTLQIFTEVSNVIESTQASALGPTTTIRTSDTTAITRDGQMIAIGGLMADNVNEASSGVPFFKDIPVLGHLFKESREDRRRTNLLIFITPRIVKDQFDARDTTLEHRDAFENELRQSDIFPGREEVLHSSRLDNVAELTPFDGKKPSTVKAPQRNESAPHVSGKREEAASEGDAPIRLKVAPKIPKFEASPEKAALAPSSQRYVVLQLTKTDRDADSRLPFPVSSAGTFGLLVPADAPIAARGFFEPGAAYAYSIDSRLVKMQVLSSVATIEEATDLHSEIGNNWYTLSPYEIMNLGSGPWVKGSSK
ncbi:MAG: type II secretion system secretin GspD [Oligoflexia bacterium]|nr:type II secretion system secretin GspD [Oligoflexia bacterium]